MTSLTPKRALEVLLLGVLGSVVLGLYLLGVEDWRCYGVACSALSWGLTVALAALLLSMPEPQTPRDVRVAGRPEGRKAS